MDIGVATLDEFDARTSQSRLLYLTRDEVNAYDAKQLGKKMAVAVRVSPQLPDVIDDIDGALCDVDSYPRHERAELLQRLILLSDRIPVAVHSYGLADSYFEPLRANLIPVLRRLHLESIKVMVLGMLPDSLVAATAPRPLIEQKSEHHAVAIAAGRS